MIHAFCLMRNHYHLLLETPSGNLSQIMRHINGAYTTYFNVKWARNGHLFQGRYKAILVEKDVYAKELSRYIHLNPVWAKIAETPAEYPWSSYNFYIGSSMPPKWLHMDFILGYFGKKISTAQKKYRQFVTSLLDRQYENPLEAVTGSVLLGSDEFVESIKDRYITVDLPNRDLPAMRTLYSGISLNQISEIVTASLGENNKLARNATIYLCRNHTSEKLKRIGNRFGISDSAVSQACKRFRLKIENNETLREQIENIENRIKMLTVET